MSVRVKFKSVFMPVRVKFKSVAVKIKVETAKKTPQSSGMTPYSREGKNAIAAC